MAEGPSLNPSRTVPGPDKKSCFWSFLAKLVKIVPASSPNYLKSGTNVEDFQRIRPKSTKNRQNPQFYQKPLLTFPRLWLNLALKRVWDGKIRQVDATKRPKIAKIVAGDTKFDTNFAKFLKSCREFFILGNFCPFFDNIVFTLNFSQNPDHSNMTFSKMAISEISDEP